jgi:polysaccharide export outer membrane protein
MIRLFKSVIALATIVLLCGCASNWLPTSGPSTKDIETASANDASIIKLVDISPAVNQRLEQNEKRQLFAQAFGDTKQLAYVANPGDVLEVSIWEASPALLFGTAPSLSGMSFASSTKNTSLPDQMVGSDGYITVPFAGRIKVAGKTLSRIEADIVQALQGKANSPQVIVRMPKSPTTNVTVVGEVAQSVMMPLTPKGERLLDAIATAGGVKQSVNKVTIQLARKGVVKAMAMDKVIQDPSQNVRLSPGDVITAFYQPYSFTALGASGKNDEINFEAQGITLSQALGRVGGVQDNRADVKGLFIFRFEEPDVAPKNDTIKATDPQGRIPTIYRLDMSDPVAFLLAQGFVIKNKDVMYVANAYSVEFSKFLNIIISVVYPIVNTGTILKF